MDLTQIDLLHLQLRMGSLVWRSARNLMHLQMVIFGSILLRHFNFTAFVQIICSQEPVLIKLTQA